MKHAPRPPHADPFAHLRAELSDKRGWKAPVLALAAVGLLVVLGTVFIPGAETARDFRHEALPAASSDDPGFELLPWSALVPKGWDPSRELSRLQKAGAGKSDSDPRAHASFASMRAVLDAAPGDPALTGRKVRIPGYVVPLDPRAEGASEFLLVPYFGACVHTPPPPANQIIHVVSSQPVKGLRAMDVVWVKGTLGVARHDTDIAVSGYRLLAVSAEPYGPARAP